VKTEEREAWAESEPDEDKGAADVTVITAAYSMERWSLTNAAVESVLRQTVLPREIIMPVDHNDALVERLREHWQTTDEKGGRPGIRVVPSKYDGHLGASATTAAELAETEFLAFLDDDAAADPMWLATLLAVFEDPTVIAVGGAPLPIYSRPRPRWFPFEFDWVFGCAYAGLPTTRAPILHMIGTTMAVRRKDFLSVGGVHSDDHGDMELSHKLLASSPGSHLMYEPAAVVRHYVHANRLTWAYFWRRCFNVNRSKAAAFRELGPAANLRAERRFAQRALTAGFARGIGEAIRGDVGGLLRSVAIVAGLSLAGSGYLVGTMQRHVRRSKGW
jgi:GT2 family glycosyltransferase